MKNVLSVPTVYGEWESVQPALKRGLDSTARVCSKFLQTFRKYTSLHGVITQNIISTKCLYCQHS